MRRVLFVGLAVLTLATTTRGEVSIVQERLSVDALTWAKCRWQQTRYTGLTNSYFDFYRPTAFVGLTGHISSVTLMRLYCDVSDLSGQLLYDLYVDFHWPSGIELRAGQFKPPLGFEALTNPYELKLVDRSLVARKWKPWNPRDVGIMVSYGSSQFEVAGALVNGNGIGQGYEDNNDWKDVCGRVVLKPLAHHGLKFACRGYYGRIDEAGLRFRNLAGEFLLERPPLQVVAEVQHAVQGGCTRNSFYVQASFKFFGLLEPVARFQMEFQSEDKYDFGVTGGLNFLVLGDRLKVMLDYNHSRRKSITAQNRVSQRTVSLQLQAAI